MLWKSYEGSANGAVHGSYAKIYKLQNYDIHCILDVHHPLRKYENQQKAEKSQDKKCLNAHHCLHIELKIRNRSSA